MEFIKEHDVKDTDIPFLELDPPRQQITNSNPQRSREEERNREKTLDYDSLEEYGPV